MKIDLLSLTQTALILRAETGIIYTNQVGGTECDHPELEGCLVPVEHAFDASGSVYPLTSKLCGLFPDGSPGVVGLEVANLIQSHLDQSPYTRDIKIDKQKISESKEAWVFVKLVGTLDDSIQNYEGVSGILTWPNSD